MLDILNPAPCARKSGNRLIKILLSIFTRPSALLTRQTHQIANHVPLEQGAARNSVQKKLAAGAPHHPPPHPHNPPPRARHEPSSPACYKQVIPPPSSSQGRPYQRHL